MAVLVVIVVRKSVITTHVYIIRIKLYPPFVYIRIYVYMHGARGYHACGIRNVPCIPCIYTVYVTCARMKRVHEPRCIILYAIMSGYGVIITDARTRLRERVCLLKITSGTARVRYI